MNEEQVMHAMSIDDAYKVERVLAQSNLGVTECVTLNGVGPFVRKKIPLSLVNRKVWAALAECTSPRLPQIAVTYEMPDDFIVVYDFIPGETLEHIVLGSGNLSLNEAVSVIKELSEALLDLHRHGIVHCDVSPGNVVIAADGAHLIDFGIAQEIHGKDAHQGQTHSYGTWGFASPEQYGFADADERSDIYSLARLMAYMLCGPLTEDKDYDQVLESRDDIPQWVTVFVKKGSAFEPSARYQNCEELLTEININEKDACGESLNDSHSKEANSFLGDVSSIKHATSENSSTRNLHDSFRAIRLSRLQEHKKLSRILAIVLAVCLIFIVVFIIASQVVYKSTIDAVSNAVLSDEIEEPSSLTNDLTNVSSDQSADPVDNPIAVVDSGWSVDEYGIVNFGVELVNQDMSHGIVLPAISVVGRSSDGSVVFSEDHPIMYIQPGETLYYGSIAGDGSAIPETIEFSISPISSYDFVPSDSNDVASFYVDNVSDIPFYEGVKFTGDVFFDGGLYPEQEASSVLVTVILRDKAGSIVYGNSTSIDKPSSDSKTSFDLPCFNIPDYETYEIHTCVW